MKQEVPLILFSVLLSFLFSVTSAVYAGEEASQIDAPQLFLQANQAYRNSDFQKAAECYEKILSSGIINGEIFYNIGNAYVKNGKLGNALLNYRRAEMFMPRDEDLQSNLQYVQSLVIDRIECKELLSFLKRFCFWYSKLNNNELATVFLITNFIFWALLIARMLYKREILTISVYVLVFLTLVLGASLSVKLYNFHLVYKGVIIEKEIMVRSGNSINDTVLFKLHEGTEFSWLKEQSGWVKISLCDGKKGWVQKRAVDIVQI